MERDDVGPEEGHDRDRMRERVDWVDLDGVGPDTLEGAPRARRPRLGAFAVALIVLLAVISVLLRQAGSGPLADAGPNPRPSARPGPVTPTHDSSGVSSLPQVIHVQPHLLGVTQRWELFGRGPEVVVRIEPAAGRVTLTDVPALASTGEVSFVAAATGAIVRPGDDVPGYAVPDGRAAQPLTGLLRSGGMVMPGPDAAHVWFDDGDRRPTSILLTDIDGKPTGPHVDLPLTASPEEYSDADGHFLVVSLIGGVYDARPGGLTRVTTGSVVAVGGQRSLVVECDQQYRCSTVLVGLTDGSRRVVPGGFQLTYLTGAISPDGLRAAVPAPRPSGGLQLRLIDLTTGLSRDPGLALSRDTSPVALVWSPDSRLLFALDAEGVLRVVSPATGVVSSLGVALPPMSQLAIRPALPSSG